ncbi:hypothetical protein ASE66_24750 [Bosea sp. Root483D1]|uniref:hypothetical protein n=1 Tax=Bosea sp. Root483D1 TaxID=1736544 RepID=UPI00070C95BA|nr:hypothetical protein ASE66_24750 [Bosea sp. Root483D1]
MLVELGPVMSDGRSQPTTSTTSAGVFQICSPGSSTPTRTSPCLQELECADREFPEADIRAAGYGVVWQGQKTWNGVAILATASAAGGYLSGRMRRPAAEESMHERHVRDGAHGLVVWAIGELLIAGLAASSVAGIARTEATGAAAATTAAGAALSQQPDPLGSAVDMLTRSTGTEPGTFAERVEATRILVRSLSSGQLDPSDRSYVASRMATHTNIAQPEAEKRIDDAFARLNQAKESAKQTAERARRMGVISAFLTAAALLVGAVAAWMAAQLGGKHRDEELDLMALFGTR